MGILSITFQDKEKSETGVVAKNVEDDGLYTVDGQVISSVRDSLRFLEKLGTVDAAKLLHRVKSDEPNPPSFEFHSHSGSGAQAGTLDGDELPAQMPLTTVSADCAVVDSTATGGVQHGLGIERETMSGPPLNATLAGTINPALLSIPGWVWDTRISESVLQPDGSFSPVDRNLSVTEALNSPLFVPSASDLSTQPESLGEEQSLDESSNSSGLSDLADEDLQPSDSISVTMRPPTPQSDPPSIAERALDRTIYRKPKSGHCKVVKSTVARDKFGQKKLLMKCSLAEKQPQLAPEELKISKGSSLAGYALCGLSDPDLQQTLEAGEGLIREDLSEHQDSCMWRDKGFWSEDALSLSILVGSSAEERFCRVFRYINTQLTRRSDRKLRLRISHALLYLSFESLTQEKRCSLRSGSQEKTDIRRATTFSVDYLLECSYPETWDLMDVQTKLALRRRLHEQKRQGSRCWRMASVLGLGALLACGDTLSRVIKNHGRYPLLKFDTIINYVANAHPGVVRLYHEFDALVKQILLGETLTAQPIRQTIDDRIRQAAVTKLTLQQVEENWRQIDPISASQKLTEEFIRDFT